MLQVVHPAPGNANGTLVNGILHHCSLPMASFPNQDILSDAEDVSEAEFNSFAPDDSYSEGLCSGLNEASIRPGIVHRLDKGTSGLLVVAKVIILPTPLSSTPLFVDPNNKKFIYSLRSVRMSMFSLDCFFV